MKRSPCFSSRQFGEPTQMYTCVLKCPGWPRNVVCEIGILNSGYSCGFAPFLLCHSPPESQQIYCSSKRNVGDKVNEQLKLVTSRRCLCAFLWSTWGFGPSICAGHLCMCSWFRKCLLCVLSLHESEKHDNRAQLSRIQFTTSVRPWAMWRWNYCDAVT